jgi:hypothetical protein
MFHRNIAFGLVTAMLACTPALVAQTEGDDRFTFAVTNAPKTGLGDDRLQVTINRWSTDAERDQFAAMLAEHDPAAVKYTLRNAEALGYLKWPGGLEYTLRYTRRTPRPDGSADVIFVVDSRVWVWWDAKVDVPMDEPFTVVHVRLDKNGVGEGKLAPASKVRSDKAVGFAVSDYDARPVVLTDFRAQRG